MSKTTKHPVIGIIVPCYNEEEIILDSASKLLEMLNGLKAEELIDKKSFIVFVNDGSKDNTWNLIKEQVAVMDHSIKAISLSRNFGHQKAVLAGITEYYQEADALVTLDADLQDDINVIGKMVRSYNAGIDIVYGVRNNRESDTAFKKFTALGFYKFMAFLGVRVVYNHADFRLSSHRVNVELMQFKETNLFLRGIFPLIGFNTSEIYYDRLPRMQGTTKYPLRKMLAFAWNGITSMSEIPLTIIFKVGLVTFFICLIMMAFVLIQYFRGDVIPGWASITLPVFFFGALQLICLGIIAEYLGKIYNEIKGRPRFILKEKI